MSTSGRTLVAPPPSGDATGVTDYNLLQGMIDVGGVMILGGGDYKISQPLLPKGATHLKGQGRFGSGDVPPPTTNYTRILPGTSFPQASSDGLMMGSSSVTSGVENVVLEDLCLDGNLFGTSVYGLVLPNNSGNQDALWVLERVCIRKAAFTNLFVGSNWRALHAHNCEFYDNGTDQNILVDGSDTRFDHCTIGGGAKSNLYLNNSILSVTACDIYGAANQGVFIKSTDGGVQITDGSLDRNSQDGILIQAGASGVSIKGVAFHSNGAAANNTYGHINNQETTTGLVSAIGCLFLANDAGYANKCSYAIINAVANGINDGGGVTAGSGSNVFVTGSTVSGYKSQ